MWDFGISSHTDASALVALGLHALQHRGQEGYGIVLGWKKLSFRKKTRISRRSFY